MKRNNLLVGLRRILGKSIAAFLILHICISYAAAEAPTYEGKSAKQWAKELKDRSPKSQNHAAVALSALLPESASEIEAVVEDLDDFGADRAIYLLRDERIALENRTRIFARLYVETASKLVRSRAICILAELQYSGKLPKNLLVASQSRMGVENIAATLVLLNSGDQPDAQLDRLLGDTKSIVIEDGIGRAVLAGIRGYIRQENDTSIRLYFNVLAAAAARRTSAMLIIDFVNVNDRECEVLTSAALRYVLESTPKTPPKDDTEFGTLIFMSFGPRCVDQVITDKVSLLGRTPQLEDMIRQRKDGEKLRSQIP
jgi:hypothetical protein